MTDPVSLYLDVLPAHPRPQPLESLTSYLRRVALANGLRTITSLAYLMRVSKPRLLLRDLPVVALNRLARLTGCSVSQCLSLTFYHLGWKFNRSRTVGRFLVNSISSTLRYCPDCLAENGYYALTWSFPWLEGCPRHGLRLLERCGHCGGMIDLTMPRLVVRSITHCPECAGDLRRCIAPTLAVLDQQTCACREEALTYLLTPQPWQSENPWVAAAARQRLGFVRLKQGITAPALMQQSVLRQNAILAIENETLSGTGETFQDYLRFADYFKVSLGQVFREAEEAGYLTKAQLSQEAFHSRFQQTLERLKQQGIPVTQKQVSLGMGCMPAALRKYPAIHQVLREEALHRKQHTPAHERALLHVTQQAIQTLESQGKRVSYRAISLRIGWTPEQIKPFFSSVETLIQEAITRYVNQCQQRETTLLKQAQQSIKALVACGQPITQKEIAHALGISPVMVGDRLVIQALIDDAKRQMEHELWRDTVARVEALLASLRQQETLVSQQLLAEHVGITRDYFRTDPELRVLWQAYVREQRRVHAAQLLERVYSAMGQLHAQQRCLTLRGIERIVGVSRTTLKQYPQIRQVFEAHQLLRPRGHHEG